MDLYRAFNKVFRKYASTIKNGEYCTLVNAAHICLNYHKKISGRYAAILINCTAYMPQLFNLSSYFASRVKIAFIACSLFSP